MKDEMTTEDIDKLLEELRLEWIEKPDKRAIIERQAALLKGVKSRMENKA